MLNDYVKGSNFTISGKLNRLKLPPTIKPEGENHMSDIINATPKGKAFTTLKIDDSTFQALFKAARAQRITVREYILSILDQHAEKLTEGK
ncbi:hypothetical protein L7P09_RS11620 [Enterobacter hormaechei]|uniref:hypothetical protein n=1 Tax=Klebsiella pneumoniae TaxID=573 RepID=UPI001F30A605|nr:hypothetical protein [Klebsiella pneumoniae]MCE7415590.1 hypothetical protein [Klebsiella pneumoniae]MDU4135427.1 hypothetical protein [Klebsiella michiganensis]HDR2464337.1 hypothetical protein [Enterobacter ludwigii]